MSAAVVASTRAGRRTSLRALGDRIGIDAPALTRTSRLVAKVDSAAVQDGFDLYLHGFFVTDDGKWTVVQQGMNGDKRQARRYHWHSEGLSSFVEEPHSAIDGPGQGNIINLTDRRAGRSRAAQLDLLADFGPDRIVREYRSAVGSARRTAGLCRISSCPRTTTCGQAMSSSAACTARWPQPPIAGPPTSRSCC